MRDEFLKSSAAREEFYSKVLKGEGSMLYIFDPQSKIFGAKKKKNLVPRGGGGCIFKGTSLEGGYPMYHRANNTTEREREKGRGNVEESGSTPTILFERLFITY